MAIIRLSEGGKNNAGGLSKQIKSLLNKAMVDCTSPALCTPVTPFSPIGGSSHEHRQHAQKISKDRACSSEDILADIQRNTQADMLL